MYRIDGQTPGAQYSIGVSEGGGVTKVSVAVRFGKAVVPEAFRVVWKEPCVDCYSTLSPSIRCDRGLHPDWRPQKTEAYINQFMPVHQVISLQGRNRMCIAVSDVETPVTIRSGVCETDACMEYTVEFFTKPTAAREAYSAVIRIDRRDIPYEESASDAVKWWREDMGYATASVPAAATDPVYSSWYSFHHRVNREGLLRECQLARPLGMKTLIIDDGWQTSLDIGGYSYCGDWQPAVGKMGDMRGLIADIHRLGMRVLLWFSAPFMGKNAARFDEFRGMFINGNERGGVYYLDPRYAKVRAYITERLTSAMTDWELDGLKIDFVNNFVPNENTAAAKPEMDCPSFTDAVGRLMRDIYGAVTSIRPDALIEFRQSYIGPAMCQCANILRVADSPADAIRNRADVLNIRLFNPGVMVHSDMLMWHAEDSVDSAAVQLANTLYAVPQISVHIEALPEEQRRMLKYYLDFWTRYKKVLLEGKLTALCPESRYVQACAALGDTAVVTCYADCLVTAQTLKLVVINASMRNELVIKNCGNRRYRINDCMGTTLASGVVGDALASFEVPRGGMVFLTCE